jgi:hypothetical protein
MRLSSATREGRAPDTKIQIQQPPTPCHRRCRITSSNQLCLLAKELHLRTPSPFLKEKNITGKEAVTCCYSRRSLP